MVMSDVARTHKELVRDLKPPKARFYPFDLHTHSLGSYDVLEASIYKNPILVRRLGRRLGGV